MYFLAWVTTELHCGLDQLLQCFGWRGGVEQGYTARKHLHVKVQIQVSLRKAEPTVDVLPENICLENDDQGVGKTGRQKKIPVYSPVYRDTKRNRWDY